jgi:hypothetical protein
MNTDTPITNAEIDASHDAMLGTRYGSMIKTARILERELNHYRAALDKQLSVTLGQMLTIRELREKLKDMAAMPNVES